MDNLDKYFKGQQRHEEFICFFRHHWVTMVKEFLYFGIFLFFMILMLANLAEIQAILQGNREMKLFFVTLFLIGILMMNRFFLKMLNYFVNIGIITDIRVIDHRKTLFFHDMIEAVDMAQIQNLERESEGFFPNILHYGNIRIFLNASDTVITFKRIPSAKFLFRCISRQKEARQTVVKRKFEEEVTSDIYGKDVPESRKIPVENP